MHPSDAILILPYAGGLLVWPVFCILSGNRDKLFRELAKIFGWTAAALAALAAAQWLIGFFSSIQVSLINFFPILNLFSLLASMVVFFQASAGPVRSFLERNFIAMAGIPAFSLMVMLPLGGCRNLDIALHEGRTIATVLPEIDSSSRKSIRYSYEVNDCKYTGSGDPGNPPYPPGSTFEIRYCTLHPSFSTARSPFEFIGIICVGSAFAAAGSFMMRRSKRPDRSSPL